MKMKENESLNDYSSRLTDLIIQMKSYGDEIEDQRIVEKILISILEIFDPIIEDLKTLGIQELLSSLKSYEHRMTRHSGKAIESAFQSILQANVETSDTWFLDSGCSNHITGDESILVDIDIARNSQVKMGNGAVVQKNMVRGLPQIHEIEGVCEGCALRKHHRKPFPKGVSWRAKEILELVHTDFYGPIRSPSHVERKNQTVVEMAKSMMHEKCLPKGFWAEAVYTAIYLLNRSPTKALDNKTPLEAWNGRKPSDEAHVESDENQPSHDEVPSEEPDEESQSPPPQKFRSLTEIYNANFCHVEPNCFEEAIREESWKKAMEDEIQVIEKNNTWELTDRPSNKDVIGVKWVYKVKYNADGQKGWLLYQLDVKSAFLNGELKEEVYVNQPQGFEVEGKEEKVYKLKKALYGLKQEPQAWYSQIDGYFKEKGFDQSKSELTLYVKNQGLLNHFLGMEIYQDDGGVFICQEKYVEKILKIFDMSECKPKETHLVVNEKLMKEDSSSKVDATLYQSLVGKLLYLTATRPDIMFAASLLSRFMHNPSQIHMGVGKRILRYFQGIKDLESSLKKNENINLPGFYDSDWGGCTDDMKSTSGYIFSIGSDIGEKQLKPTIIFCDSMSAIAIAKNPIYHSRTKNIALKHLFIREAIEDGEVQLEFCRTNDQLADIFRKALPRQKFQELRRNYMVQVQRDSIHEDQGLSCPLKWDATGINALRPAFLTQFGRGLGKLVPSSCWRNVTDI
ncbi:retrovirus-related pol polyprotein from transposon TNT 1-94 [Tanacetum coccineum]|uniref:Retrovirus-related pol polyprotein from transposon TNT 1-94 n=1 Tax=Tanacetum coccineum TaxID=301880 RepID=A0ABQ5CHK8_9ASTR